MVEWKHGHVFFMFGASANWNESKTLELGNIYGLKMISMKNVVKEVLESPKEIGKKVKYVMNRHGNLSTSDQIDLIKAEMEKSNASKGFLIHDFPLKVKHAKKFDQIGGNATLVYLKSSNEYLKKPMKEQFGVYSKIQEEIVNFFEKKKQLITLNADDSTEQILESLCLELKIRNIKKVVQSAPTQPSAEILPNNDVEPKAKILGRSISNSAEIAFNTFIQDAISAGIDGIRKQFTDVKSYAANNLSHQKFDENPERNRYGNIVCYDSSRVVLRLDVPPRIDYIHANWVSMVGCDRKFIATQGPLNDDVDTRGEFWRMAYQEKVAAIVMLCKCEENGKSKCAQYWSSDVDGSLMLQGILVTTKRVEVIDNISSNLYTLEICKFNSTKPLVVKLYNFLQWPDHGVPTSGMSILRLLKMISNDSLSIGPAIVHCSAGAGRTGTLIAIETAIQRLLKGEKVKMFDIVKQMRNQRAVLLQTEHQYIFAHLSVMYYIGAKIPDLQKQVLEFERQWKKPV